MHVVGRSCNTVPIICDCLRCFYTVFQRPYRYFSIALKVFFPCPIAIKCSPAVIAYGLKFVKTYFLSKIYITVTTINNKILKLVKAEFYVI